MQQTLAQAVEQATQWAKAGALEDAVRGFQAIMAQHGAMEAARADALAWAAKARAALQVLPDHPLKSMLDDLADYVVARVN